MPDQPHHLRCWPGPLTLHRTVAAVSLLLHMAAFWESLWTLGAGRQLTAPGLALRRQHRRARPQPGRFGAAAGGRRHRRADRAGDRGRDRDAVQLPRQQALDLRQLGRQRRRLIPPRSVRAVPAIPSAREGGGAAAVQGGQLGPGSLDRRADSQRRLGRLAADASSRRFSVSQSACRRQSAAQAPPGTAPPSRPRLRPRPSPVRPNDRRPRRPRQPRPDRTRPERCERFSTLSQLGPALRSRPAPRGVAAPARGHFSCIDPARVGVPGNGYPDSSRPFQASRLSPRHR